MASKLKQYIKEEYQRFANVMDNRYGFYKLLRDHYNKHGSVPEQFEKDWEVFQVKEAGLLWYEQKHAVKTLWKAARMHAKRRVKEERRK